MTGALDTSLVAYWPFREDPSDHSGAERHGLAHHVSWRDSAAVFDGSSSSIEIPDHPALRLGRSPFTISVWVHTEGDLAGPVGDICCKFDPAARAGFHLSVVDLGGVTSAYANHRNTHFGIDAGTTPSWQDYGRPGAAVLIYSLAVCRGELFAGTYEHGPDQRGTVYRCSTAGVWQDLKIPSRSNCVSSLVPHQGRLYAATGHYDARGSSLGEAGNADTDSRVWCLEPDGSWTGCGTLPGEPDLPILGLYRGRLYAAPNYRTGLYRFEGGTEWKACAPPYPRFFALTQWRGHLYAAANRSLRRLGPPPDHERIFTPLPDADGVYRYDDRDDRWTGCGPVGQETQMYGFAVHLSQLFVGTWPNASVFRSPQGIGWQDCGRIHPDEQEIMAMGVYNGKLYVGTLPSADVYRYDGDNRWTPVGHTDRTAGVRYRRAWSMAVQNGTLFVGTLPSGHVHAMRAGLCVSDDHALPAGWHQVTAVREPDRLHLYLDGQPQADSIADGRRLDVSNGCSLHIGTGIHSSFQGSLKHMRLYRRSLDAEEVNRLYRRDLESGGAS